MVILRKSMKVSIIIPYNSIQYTVPCINSIIKSTSGVDCEIISVCDHSTEQVGKFIKAYNYRDISSGKKTGFSAAVNTGIKASSGDYIVFINNDTITASCWLQNMLRCCMESNKAGIVGPRSNNVLKEQFLKTGKNTDNIYKLEKFMTEYNRPNPALWFETKYLSGFCMLIPRDIISNIGFLDENFLYGGFEDIDYCIRAKKHGFRLMCAGDTFIYHYGQKSMGKLKNVRDIYIHNKIYFDKKWNKI